MGEQKYNLYGCVVLLWTGESFFTAFLKHQGVLDLSRNICHMKHDHGARCTQTVLYVRKLSGNPAAKELCNFLITLKRLFVIALYFKLQK